MICNVLKNLHILALVLCSPCLYEKNITDATFSSAALQREKLCLSILHKWHTLPICGYHLVPEHVETRTLYDPNKPGIEQV